MQQLKFPKNKKFAFTIVDDTDNASVVNVKPIYELLLQLNIITTKTIWIFPTDNVQNRYYHSLTLANPKYLKFVKWLRDNGFEIAFHGASMSSSIREQTQLALEQFKKYLDFYPNIHINHSMNRENLYWGHERLDLPLLRYLIKLKRKLSYFEGHKPDSPFFWGDLCQKHITYVRNLVFREINSLKINPTLPYKDPKRPFVNYWFSSSDGRTPSSFNRLLSPKNQDKLEHEKGVCMVYTHFGCGFVENGRVNTKTKELLIELSKRDGWFVPASTLLDYLRTQRQREYRTFWERISMEARWAINKAIYGSN